MTQDLAKLYVYLVNIKLRALITHEHYITTIFSESYKYLVKRVVISE